MTTFLTADPHFGHAKMIEDGMRPFSSVAEMNQVMIANWNRVVNAKDVVWVIGDFAFSMTEDEVAEVFHALNGRLRLVLGNHDLDHSGELRKGIAKLPWDRIVTRAEIKHGRQRIILDHYAGLTWSADHYGSYLAYGHSHGKLTGLPGSIDVGMDVQGYRPISVEEFVAQADETVRDHERRLEEVISSIRRRAAGYADRVLMLDAERPRKP
jgi:calcineurin-like phosphoesterase family protein